MFVSGVASGRAMLNSGCVFAAAFWICVTVRSGNRPAFSGNGRVFGVAALGIALAISLSAFWRTLWNPFQFDAFTHLSDVHAATFPHVLERFTPKSGDRLFFRPVGFLVYWLDARWAGPDLLRWHLVNVVLHALNGLAVYLLFLRLDLRRWLAGFGAAVFLTSGLTAEPVAWIDIPFDLLATLFVLLGLLALLRGRLPVSLALIAIGCCTKESAFCAPLLALALSFTKTGEERKRVFSGALAMTGCCAALFAYRGWALHGFGGYETRYSFKFLFRMWGVLLFPVNWSTPVPVGLWIALAVCCAGLLYTAVRGRARRNLILPGLAWAVAALIPAAPLAMISSDLSGARVYYLASVGIALALASAMEGQALTAVAIVAFNFVALEHNLEPWFRVSRQAAEICRNFRGYAAHVPDLPEKRDGVYFLANGFPECVAFYSHQKETQE